MLLPLYRLSHTDTHIHQSDIRSCLPFNLWLQAQASDSEWRTRVAVTIRDHEVSECVSANVTTSTTLFSDHEYMYSSDAFFFFFLKVWIIQRKCEEEMYSKVANLLSCMCAFSYPISIEVDVKWLCTSFFLVISRSGLFFHKQSCFHKTKAQGHKLEVGRRALHYPSSGSETLCDSLLSLPCSGRRVRDERQTKEVLGNCKEMRGREAFAQEHQKHIMPSPFVSSIKIFSRCRINFF